MGDQSVVVRDSVAWTLGRICEILPQVVIGGKLLQPLVESLLESLKAEPRVAANVCWVSCLSCLMSKSCWPVCTSCYQLSVFYLHFVAQSDQLNSFSCHLFIMSKWNYVFTLYLLIKGHIIIFKKRQFKTACGYWYNTILTALKRTGGCIMMLDSSIAEDLS